MKIKYFKSTIDGIVNGCLSFCVDPVVDSGYVQGVLHLLPNNSRDRLQQTHIWTLQVGKKIDDGFYYRQNYSAVPVPKTHGPINI